MNKQFIGILARIPSPIENSKLLIETSEMKRGWVKKR